MHIGDKLNHSSLNSFYITTGYFNIITNYLLVYRMRYKIAVLILNTNNENTLFRFRKPRHKPATYAARPAACRI
jgi:hypothetical protein